MISQINLKDCSMIVLRLPQTGLVKV